MSSASSANAYVIFVYSGLFWVFCKCVQAPEDCLRGSKTVDTSQLQGKHGSICKRPSP